MLGSCDKSTDTIKYLGKFDTLDDCEAACLSYQVLRNSCVLVCLHSYVILHVSVCLLSCLFVALHDRACLSMHCSPRVHTLLSVRMCLLTCLH